MSHDIACPACGFEFDLLQAMAEQADQDTVARFVAAALPIGDRLMHYVQLFAPPQHRLTIRKKLKVVLQLLPDLERRSIHHKGKDVDTPLIVWAAAIDQVLGARTAGTLVLPLRAHAYLYSVLATEAAKHAAAPKQAPVTPASAGRDPALVKLETDSKNGVPIPAEILERMQRIRTGATTNE